MFLAELAARLHESHDAGALLLIGRRDMRSNNSFMHNVENLVRGERRCTLLMHPTDATARGISDGAKVRVSSRTGELDVEAQVTDAVMPGVVSLPHGWGTHHRWRPSPLTTAFAFASFASTALSNLLVRDQSNEAHGDRSRHKNVVDGTRVAYAARSAVDTTQGVLPAEPS